MVALLNVLGTIGLVAQDAQEYQISHEQAAGAFAIFGAFFAVFMTIMLAVYVVMVIGMWKTFTKAGKPGWAAIIPIYNMVILIEMSGKPMWYIIWFILPIIPIPFLNGIFAIVSLVFMFIINIEIAKQFGLSGGFGVGMTLLPVIFWPILGFGSAQYSGGASSVATPQVPTAPPVQ